jgi:hypothetical protein
LSLNTFNIFQIEILAFPGHTTHILQPLDVGGFGPLKRKFHSLSLTMARISHSMTISKAALPKVWNATINSVCSPAFVMGCFRKSGLVPFNINAIDRSKLRKSVKKVDVNATVDVNNNNNTAAPAAAPAPTKAADEVLVCPTCGKMENPHPVFAVQKLPPLLRIPFQVPAQKQPGEEKKTRLAITKGRRLTGDEWTKKLKDKVSGVII